MDRINLLSLARHVQFVNETYRGNRALGCRIKKISAERRWMRGLVRISLPTVLASPCLELFIVVNWIRSSCIHNHLKAPNDFDGNTIKRFDCKRYAFTLLIREKTCV